mmetsp:Transcript_117953/g.279993  ORF Transcript_117953/g.279993 Transcript_117953/m.279993 type:complete len:238 (-) Transcript_117953:298-1011(-)
MSMTTATIKFNTPKTNVKSERTKMMAVSGCFKISGTAMRPQLSPAITVWNSSRFARITEDVASKQRSPQLAKSGLSFISGCSISTINMAHRVMITKQRRNDQSKALKHVVIMVASFCSSFKERLFRSSRISLLMRTKRRARRRLIAPTSSGVRKLAITISAYPQRTISKSRRGIQLRKIRSPPTKIMARSSAVYMQRQISERAIMARGGSLPAARASTSTTVTRASTRITIAMMFMS